MIGAIVPIVAIVTGSPSQSLALSSRTSSRKKDLSIYLFRDGGGDALAQALTIGTLGTIGRLKAGCRTPEVDSPDRSRARGTALLGTSRACARTAPARARALGAGAWIVIKQNQSWATSPVVTNAQRSSEAIAQAHACVMGFERLGRRRIDSNVGPGLGTPARTTVLNIQRPNWTDARPETSEAVGVARQS